MRKIIVYTLLTVLLALITALELDFTFKSDLEADEQGAFSVSQGLLFNTDKIDHDFSQAELFENNNLNGVKKAVIKGESGNCITFNSALHLWLKSFGASVLSARSFSIFFFCGAIILTFLLSLLIFKCYTTALLSAFFIALNPLQILYGHNCRSYTMVVFFSLLSTYLFVYITTKANEIQSRKHYFTACLYGLVSAIAILGHYFALFVVTIHGMWALIQFLRDNTSTKKILAVSYIFCFLLLILWMINGGFEGYQHMAEGNNFHKQYSLLPKEKRLLPFIEPTSFSLTIKYLSRTFIVWTANNEYWNYFDLGLKMRYILLIFIVPIIFLGCTILILRKNKAITPYFFFLIGIIVFTPLMCIYMAYSSGHTVSYADKYAIFAMPYFIILLAWGATYFFTSNIYLKFTGFTLITVFILNSLIEIEFLHNRYSETTPHILNLTQKICPKMEKIEKGYYLEFHSKETALKFNLYLYPRYPQVKQRYNPNVTKGEIWLTEFASNKHELFYMFSPDFNDADTKYVRE